MTEAKDYRLDDQIGYVLRRVTQRHLAIFAAAIPEVTTTQFAVLARLAETGPLSQNHLGRETSLDAATVKGVVDRLSRLGLVQTRADTEDRRRLTVSLTSSGLALFQARAGTAQSVSAETLAPLSEAEIAALKSLLARLT
ncbi:MAG TPA: MarR family transcriptional regulator [Tabrizicola sp.]|nr:MarR family transcriptional regulator [Tabrizicola sp.]